MKSRALLFVAVSLVSAAANAQQVDDRARGAARTLAEDGVTALQNGDAASAVDKLGRAYQIIKLPTVGLWSARALVKAGRLVSAAERYNEVARYSGTGDAKQDQAKADAQREREELLPRLPSATFVIEGAKASEVTVTLDGDPVLPALIGTPIPVDPKHHVLKGTRGEDSVEQPFDIAEGQKLTVSLRLGTNAAPAPAPAPAAAPVAAPATPAATQAAPGADSGTSSGSSFWNTQRTIGVIVGGAGVVSAVVSGVFTAGALGKKSDAKAYCDSGQCTDQKGVDLLSDARSAGNLATITGIAGIALVGAGVVLFVTAPSGDGSKVAVSTSYLPGGGGLLARGSF